MIKKKPQSRRPEIYILQPPNFLNCMLMLNIASRSILHKVVSEEFSTISRVFIGVVAFLSNAFLASQKDYVIVHGCEDTFCKMICLEN